MCLGSCGLPRAFVHASEVLSLILADKNSEELIHEVHELLRKTGDDVRSDNYPLEKYIINKVYTSVQKSNMVECSRVYCVFFYGTRA